MKFPKIGQSQDSSEVVYSIANFVSFQNNKLSLLQSIHGEPQNEGIFSDRMPIDYGAHF